MEEEFSAVTIDAAVPDLGPDPRLARDSAPDSAPDSMPDSIPDSISDPARTSNRVAIACGV